MAEEETQPSKGPALETQINRKDLTSGWFPTFAFNQQLRKWFHAILLILRGANFFTSR